MFKADIHEANENAYINAIIDTDYEEKYGDLILELAQKANSWVDPKDIQDNELYQQANDELMQYLAIGYTTNPNFVKDFNNSKIKPFVRVGDFVFNDDVTTKKQNMFFYRPDEKYLIDKDKNEITLANDEIAMTYTQFNQLFDTEWTYQNCHEYVANSQTLKISTYNPCDEKFEKPVFEKTFKIKAILRSSKSGSAYYCSEAMFDQLAQKQFYTWQVYFDGYDDAEALYAKAGDLGYLPTAIMVEGLSTMAYAVESFIDLFELISIVLYAACAVVIINFSLKLVKQRKYDIGVLRALGCKNSSLAIICVTQIMLVGLMICLMTFAGMYVFIDLANDVLVESLKRLAESFIVFDMQFLTFKPGIIFADCVSALVLTLLSTIAPLAMLRKIKPINIIKSKE